MKIKSFNGEKILSLISILNHYCVILLYINLEGILGIIYDSIFDDFFSFVTVFLVYRSHPHPRYRVLRHPRQQQSVYDLRLCLPSHDVIMTHFSLKLT